MAWVSILNSYSYQELMDLWVQKMRLRQAFWLSPQNEQIYVWPRPEHPSALCRIWSSDYCEWVLLDNSGYESLQNWPDEFPTSFWSATSLSSSKIKYIENQKETWGIYTISPRDRKELKAQQQIPLADFCRLKTTSNHRIPHPDFPEPLEGFTYRFST